MLPVYQNHVVGYSEDGLVYADQEHHVRMACQYQVPPSMPGNGAPTDDVINGFIILIEYFA